MFGKFVNSYLYGKSGKGDFTPEDLPQNRRQLFGSMLRVRLNGLVRLNLLYMISWLPALLIIVYHLILAYTALTGMYDANVLLTEGSITQAELDVELQAGLDSLRSIAAFGLLFLIPALTITGPFTAGLCYVTRNWARDEHAFVFSDFKDAVKGNWKQGLLTSFITSLVPFVAYVCWDFYGSLADQNTLFIVPQMLTLFVAVLWMMSLIFTYPLLVTYRLTYRQLMRNAFLLTIGRLPQTLIFRLATLVPALIALSVSFLTAYTVWAIGLVFLYYVILGFAFSRFITASFTNAVFDKYINSRMKGVAVNRGLYKDDEDDEDDNTDATDYNHDADADNAQP